MLSGQGGYCLIIQPFFCGFLQNLGYDASLIHAACRNIPNNHTAIVVKNVVEDGDEYLIDVAIG